MYLNKFKNQIGEDLRAQKERKKRHRKNRNSKPFLFTI